MTAGKNGTRISNRPADAEAGQERIESVSVSDRSLTVHLDGGRAVAVPLAKFPSLEAATPQQRDQWRIIGDGSGISWPKIDEDLSLEGILRAAGLRPPRSDAPALHRILANEPASQRGEMLYVHPHEQGWAIRKSGKARASGVFRTQREAVEEARKLARQMEGEFVLKGADGRIREYRSYYRAKSSPHEDVRLSYRTRGLSEPSPAKFSVAKRKKRS